MPDGDWYWWSGYNAEILRWKDTDGFARATRWMRVTVGPRTGIVIFIEFDDWDPYEGYWAWHRPEFHTAECVTRTRHLPECDCGGNARQANREAETNEMILAQVRRERDGA